MEENKEIEGSFVDSDVFQKTMVKEEFPFDLNKLFSLNLNYNFDTLKQAIEYLATE